MRSSIESIGALLCALALGLFVVPAFAAGSGDRSLARRLPPRKTRHRNVPAAVRFKLDCQLSHYFPTTRTAKSIAPYSEERAS